MQGNILATKIRLYVQDSQKTRYSDYEVVSAINSAAAMLWIALAEMYSSFPLKRARLPIRTDEEHMYPYTLLPQDYYSLIEKPDGTNIAGDIIEFPNSEEGTHIDIVYNCIPLPLDSLADDIAVPLSMLLDFVSIAGEVIRGDNAAAQSIADYTARRICQKREMSCIPDTEPWS